VKPVRRKAEFKKDVISYGILASVEKAMQFLMLPLLTRLFSQSDYGLIDVIGTVTGLVGILATLSLESSVARIWHDTEKDTGKSQAYASIMLFATAFGSIVFILSWITALATGWKRNISELLPIAVAATILGSVASIPKVVLRMQRDVLKFGILQCGGTALGTALSMLLMIKFSSGIAGLFIGNLLASLFVLGAGLYSTRQFLQSGVSFSALTDCLRYSLPLVPAVLLSWLNGQVDRFILAASLGLGIVGVYGAAARLALVILLFTEVFRLAWVPFAMKQINQPTRNSFFRASLTGYLAVMTSIGMILVAYSRELLTAIVPAEYASGYVVMPWLIGTQIFLGSASVTNVGMLISKKTAGNSIAAAFGTAINVILCSLLVSQLGLSGAALGAFTSAFVFTGMLLALSWAHAAIPFDYRNALGLVALYIIECVCILMAYERLTDCSLIVRTALLATALLASAAIYIASTRKTEVHSANDAYIQ
jgi:O-antigen/teichoic acid export membrane protein